MALAWCVCSATSIRCCTHHITLVIVLVRYTLCPLLSRFDLLLYSSTCMLLLSTCSLRRSLYLCFTLALACEGELIVVCGHPACAIRGQDSGYGERRPSAATQRAANKTSATSKPLRVHLFEVETHFSVALRKGDTRLTKSDSNIPEDDQQLRKKLRPKIAGERVVQDEQNIKKRAVFHLYMN